LKRHARELDRRLCKETRLTKGRSAARSYGAVPTGIDFRAAVRLWNEALERFHVLRFPGFELDPSSHRDVHRRSPGREQLRLLEARCLDSNGSITDGSRAEAPGPKLHHDMVAGTFDDAYLARGRIAVGEERGVGSSSSCLRIGCRRDRTVPLGPARGLDIFELVEIGGPVLEVPIAIRISGSFGGGA
jgi:hypothetical protein